MKSLFLTVLTLLALALAPAVAFAQTANAAGASTPISQSLVREGTFAYALAGALDLGTATDETAAESMLSSAGIAPKNGWIADYPVTPEIVGDLENAVVASAEAGKIQMNKDDAVAAFTSVADKYGLSVREGETGETGSPPSYSDETQLGGYYYAEGPPVVTYYAPPPAYAYLYNWVSYPFWWYDYWFPGFYVLIDFDRTIIVHGHHEHFSNHFFDRNRERFSRLVPEHRFHRGGFGRPEEGFARPHRGERHDVTRGMGGIMKWRRSFSGGNRNFSLSPGAGRMRHSFRSGASGTSIVPSPGRTGVPPAANSFREFRPDRGIRQHFEHPSIAPRSSHGEFRGNAGRSFEGERTFETPHWEGGHSFGGFRGSSGGRFRR